MRYRRSIASSIAVALAMAGIATSPLGPPNATAQACASPLAPGPWTGSFTSNQRLNIQRIRTRYDWTNTGSLDLTVACDGTVTGSFTLKQVGRVRQPSGRSTCTMPSTRVGLDGSSVTSDRAGMPVLVLIGQTAAASSSICTGFAEFGLGGPRGIPIGISLAGASQYLDTWTGTQMSWEGPAVWVDYLALWQRNGGRLSQNTTWSLIPAGPLPTPQDPPTVTAARGVLSDRYLVRVGPVLERFTASVDWGDGDPISVKFALGSLPPRTVPATELGADAVLDLSRLRETSQLVVTAKSSAGDSLPFPGPIVTMVPVPAWATSAEWFPEVKDGSVEYTGRLLLPEPAVAGLTVDLPSWIPYVGGRWGLEDTQFLFGLATVSDGDRRSAPIRVRGGLALGSRRDTLEASGTTSLRLDPTDLQVLNSSVDLSLQRPLSYTASLGVFELVGIPYGGGISVNATISGTVSGTGVADVRGDGTFGFVEGTVTPELEVTVGGVVGSESVGVGVSGGGRGSMTIRLEPTLKVIGCQVALLFRATANAWIFGSGTYEKSWPFKCSIGQARGTGDGPGRAYVSAALPGPATDAPPLELRVRPRPEEWQPERASDRPMGSPRDGSTLLVEGIPGWAEPRLAALPSGRMALAWASEDGTKPRAEAAEIRLRVTDASSGWDEPIAVTADRRLDVAPALAFTDDDHVLLLWSTHREPRLAADAVLDRTLLGGLEVAWAEVDLRTALVSRRGTLTDDRLADLAPRLSRGPDGTVWAGWMTDTAGEPIRAADAPGRVTVARWTRDGWSDPEIIVDEVPGLADWTLAAASDERALVAYSTDTDGDPATSADRDIEMVRRLSTGWAAPQRFPIDGQDGKPVAAARADGSLLLAWWNGDRVLGLTEDSSGASPEPATWIEVAPGTAPQPVSAALAIDPEGTPALTWTGTDGSGPGTWVARQAAPTDSWTEPTRLPGLGGLDTGSSMAVSSDGSLALARSIAAWIDETVLAGGFDAPDWSETPDLVVSRIPKAESLQR